MCAVLSLFSQLMDHKNAGPLAEGATAAERSVKGVALCYNRCITHKRGSLGQRQAEKKHKVDRLAPADFDSYSKSSSSSRAGFY